MEVLDKHKSEFGQDFSDNKKTLDKITIIRSKGLKNEIAGYITKYIKHEIHDNEIKHAQQEDLDSEPDTEGLSENTEEVIVESTEETPAVDAVDVTTETTNIGESELKPSTE